MRVTDELLNLDYGGITNEQILEHFNYRCVLCGSTWLVALHHIIFRSQGGHNQPRLPLCGNCHHKLHNAAGFRAANEPKLVEIALLHYELHNEGILDQ